jgi:hypothetical protein
MRVGLSQGRTGVPGNRLSVLNGKRKRSCRKDQVRIEKMNENEPLMKCREHVQSVKTTGISMLGDQSAAGNLSTGCMADGIKEA